jgi:hypothetical protein
MQPGGYVSRPHGIKEMITMQTNTTDNKDEKKMPVIFANDLDSYDPYEDGDYTLLVEVASWLLRTYDEARQEWALGREGWTEDELLLSLGRMHLSEVQLAHFHRLLKAADSAVSGQEEHQVKLRTLAKAVAR